MSPDFRINTSRLILRPYTLEDVDNLYTLWGDAEVMRLIPEGVAEHSFIEMIMPFIVQSFADCQPEDFQNFGMMVTLPDTGEVVGWCGLIKMFPFPENIELYVGFAKPYWGKGYAEEVAEALMDYGFNVFGFDEITAVVVPEHNASKHILEKMGMEFRYIVTGSPEQWQYYDGLLLYSKKKTKKILSS